MTESFVAVSKEKLIKTLLRLQVSCTIITTDSKRDTHNKTTLSTICKENIDHSKTVSFNFFVFIIKRSEVSQNGIIDMFKINNAKKS